MKRITALVAATLFTSTALHAEAPAMPDPQIVAMIKEIQTQQAQIAENAGKIEQKLATITEAVRQARIYASRGGR